MTSVKKIFLILSILTIASCKKEDTLLGSNTIGQEIVPAKIGNQWLSTVTRYDTAGTISSVGNDTMWISRDTVIRGIKYFTFLESQYILDAENGMLSRVHLYDARNTSIGFVKWISPGETILYKFPSHIGELYVFVVDTSITVFAGTFSCVGYKVEALPTIDDPFGIRAIVFLCPNVGFIKSEIFMSSDYSPILYKRGIVELVTYRLNN